MGLFRKEKKDEPEEKKPEPQVVEVQESKEIVREEKQVEIEYLDKEILTKKEGLESITKKLDSVKEEYEIAVGNLMKTKKEFGEKKDEIEKMQSKYEQIKSKSDEISKNIKNIEKEFSEKKSKLDDANKKFSELEEIKSQIKRSEEENTKLNLLLKQGKEKLDGINKEKEKAENKLSELIVKLHNVEGETKIIEKGAKPKGKTSQTQISSGAQKLANKNVIEAASSVVSSLNAKLHNSQKELEAIKQVLEKERKEHQETKKKLEKLESSK